MSDVLDELTPEEVGTVVIRRDIYIRKLMDEKFRLAADNERLRAEDPQYPCESCGKMTVSITSEEIVCLKCYEAVIRRTTFLDAAKMAESYTAPAGNAEVMGLKYNDACKHIAAKLRAVADAGRAAEGVKDAN